MTPLARPSLVFGFCSSSFGCCAARVKPSARGVTVRSFSACCFSLRPACRYASGLSVSVVTRRISLLGFPHRHRRRRRLRDRHRHCDLGSHLSRPNWGTPMSLRVEHELVDDGSVCVRTASNLFRHSFGAGGHGAGRRNWWGVLLALLFAYFVYAARAEERLMAAHFPAEYSAYARRT